MRRRWIPQYWHDFVGGIRGFRALCRNHAGVGSIIEAWNAICHGATVGGRQLEALERLGFGVFKLAKLQGLVM